jgi:hypothetical protein
MRLEVNQATARQKTDQGADPGASSGLQGYAGHYCSVPDRNEPGVVACSFILSGLRLFDVRDPLRPKEIAYFNAPVHPSSTGGPGSNYAMSSPAFAANRGEVWYSDGNNGFFAVKVTNGVWPFVAGASVSSVNGTASGVPASENPTGTLPATGTSVPLAAFGMTLLGVAFVLRRAAKA